jgi:hypothetical protein
VFQKMAGSMEQMCLCARVLLWRWLGKRCRRSYHYRAIPPFRELFDCPSYISPCWLHISKSIKLLGLVRTATFPMCQTSRCVWNKSTWRKPVNTTFIKIQ